MTTFRLRTAAPLLALTIALGLGGCGSETDDPGGDTGAPTTSDAAPTTGDENPPTDDAPTTEEPSMTPTDPADPTGDTALPTGPVSDETIARDDVQAAIADLAEREGVDPGAVTVAGFHSVTWNDGSIGCPKPGMMYTQALVPGHLLVLELDGQLFSYHSADRGGQGGVFNYCENPRLPSDLGQGLGGPTM